MKSTSSWNGGGSSTKNSTRLTYIPYFISQFLCMFRLTFTDFTVNKRKNTTTNLIKLGWQDSVTTELLGDLLERTMDESQRENFFKQNPMHC